jgi:hypothetical protein
VLDVKGVPKVFCDLRENLAEQHHAVDEIDEGDDGEEQDEGEGGDDEDDEDLLRSGPEDEMPTISASVVRLAKVNERNWVLFCTEDWIWAASD